VTQNIIDKISKLLALADERSGGTEAERQAAQDAAQKLMLKHNLNAASISDNQRSADGDVTDDRIDVKGAMNQWRIILMASVADPSFVKLVRWKFGKHNYQVQLIGRPDNLAYVKLLCEHLIPWLEDECKAASAAEAEARGAEFFNPRAFKRSFMESASRRIYDRLGFILATSDVGTALIRNEIAANEQFLEDRNLKVTKRMRMGGSAERSGHAAGRDAGGRADLTPGRKLGA
jgi:hypothetical protein